jgi:hypothetical protein
MSKSPALSAGHRAARKRGAGLRAALRRHGVVLPIYLLIALLYTYPTAVHLTDAIGGELDNLENYWNLWWTYRALLVEHQNPYFADVMYYPFGIPLYFHTYNFVNGVLSLPIQACCGTAAAYNILNIFAFVMAGLGMYALVWYLTRQRVAAGIAGLVFAFSPYMALQLSVGEPFMLSLEWIPFYLLALLRGLRERWPWLVLAGLLLAVIGLTDWYYLSFTVALTGVVGIYELARLRSWRGVLAAAGRLALVGAVFAALMAPVLVPAILEALRDPYAVRPIDDSIYHTTDLLAFFLPSMFHPLWGQWASRILLSWFDPNALPGVATLGYAAMALALVGVARDWRRSALFALIFAVFFVLALGPYLQVNGVNSYTAGHPIPLPYLLYHKLPFMNLARFPTRFVAIVMLAFAVLVGNGVAWLWSRPWLQRRSVAARAGAAALLALAVLFEYWPAPFRITPVGPEQVSPFYRQLASDPAHYAILEVPYTTRTSMFYQTYHGKATVYGHIARPQVHPWLDARVFGPLLKVAPPTPQIGADTGPQAWRDALACQQVRYVVFYKQGAAPSSRARKLEQAIFPGVAPAYEDATLRAYQVPQAAPRELYWTPAFGEWYDTEATSAGVNYRWMQGDHGTILVYPCGQPTRAVMRFNAYSDDRPRTLEVRVNGELAATVALQRQVMTPVELPLSLRAGENRVELRSVEPAIPAASLGYPQDTRVISISVSQVAVVPG